MTQETYRIRRAKMRPKATLAARTNVPDDVVLVRIFNPDILLSKIFSLLWDENNGTMNYGRADRVVIVLDNGLEEEYTRGHEESPILIETTVTDEDLRIRAREFAASYIQAPIILDCIPNPFPIEAS